MIENKFIETIKNKKINLTEKDVLERLLDRRRFPRHYICGQPSIEAILEDGRKTSQDFFDKDGYVNSLECIKAYEDGYTLILSNIGGFVKDTWIIQQWLNKTFNIECNCNFYFGTGKKTVSYIKHSHDYPVIVKNIYGEGVWVINGKEKIVTQQDCIWFDKGVEHQVIDIKNKRLSMTCNIK